MRNLYEPEHYEIRLKGHLENRWAARFERLSIRLTENGETLLTGPVDQAALHSVLRKVRDLGMPLLSVMYVEPEQAERSGTNEAR